MNETAEVCWVNMRGIEHCAPVNDAPRWVQDLYYQEFPSLHNGSDSGSQGLLQDPSAPWPLTEPVDDQSLREKIAGHMTNVVDWVFAKIDSLADGLGVDFGIAFLIGFALVVILAYLALVLVNWGWQIGRKLLSNTTEPSEPELYLARLQAQTASASVHTVSNSSEVELR